MKRIVNALTIFVSILIFVFFYQNISLEHYNSVSDFQSRFFASTKKDYVAIEYRLSGDNSGDAFNELIEFLDQHNYDAISQSQNRRYDFILDTTFYIHTKNSLNNLDFFKSVNGKDIDFTSDTNSYYSSFIEDKDAIDIIDFINNSYHKEYQPRLTIKQFKSMIKDKADKRNAIIFLYGNKYDEIIKDIENSEIVNYIVDDDFVSFELVEPDVLDIEPIRILLILSIASLMVISICDLIKEKKEITIRKLFGERDFSIYFNLIAKKYLFNLILYILTQVFLYIILIRNIRPIHLLLVKPLLFAFSLYLIIWLFANLISYFVLTQVGRAVNLKKDNTVKFTNPITSIIKVIVIVLMITPFLGLFSSAPLTIEENIILRKNKNKMRNNLIIYGVYFDDSDYDSGISESLELTLEFFEDFNWIYHDFSANYLPEEYIETISEEEYQEQFVQHPYIVVNDTYLKDYDLRDLDGNSIDLDTLEHNTLLVPEIYRDDEFTDIYYEGANSKTLYIRNNDLFYNYYPLGVIEELRQENPVILFKNQLDSNMTWSGNALSIIDDESTREKVDNFLVSNDFDNIIHMESTNNIYDMIISRSNDQLLNFILRLFLYILMIFIFQYQSVFVYFSENKDKVALNYLFGKTYIEGYGVFMFNNILVYIVPLLIGIIFLEIHYKFMFIYILFGILIDIIVATIMIRSFEKNKILSVLKGE